MGCMMSRLRPSADSSNPASDANSGSSDSNSAWSQQHYSVINTLSDQSLRHTLLREVHRHFSGPADAADDIRTALPWLSLIRQPAPTPVGRGMLQPCICLIIQGEKEMLVGGLRVDLDPKEIAAFMLEMDLPRGAGPGHGAVVTVEPAGTGLMDAFLRLLRLLEHPKDLPVLGRLLEQEVMYYLLAASGGGVLSCAVAGGQREQAVSKAISWIRAHYDEPLKIAALAEAVHLSPSVLHRRFKAATIMSPLQYQKQVRLLEARRLLMSGSREAATVACQVGYESPSQFGREYRRLFGATPMQDAQQLRGSLPEP